ncbi:MAG TPA: hypothetical protein VH280_00645 [Verrucomicrobiae bacterium]|nr:hypothetical protein [Verrucomicrobiae bacterium]
MNIPNTIKKLAIALSIPAISILSHSQANAAPFTLGNIAVLQEGDGVNSLSATSAPVAIVEFTPGGGLVQTINIPSSGSTRLTQSGNSATEGYLSLSMNSSNLVFAGYDANAGLSGVAASNSASVNRCVGVLDAFGNYTRTAVSSSEYSGGNIRAATSDGTNYWTSGSTGGIWYSANGGKPVQIGNESSSSGNLRVSKVFNGRLYYTTGSGTIGLFVMTNGLPTSATNAFGNIIVDGGSSPSPYDFAINAASNIIYLADSRATASGGGIEKWTNSVTGWGLAYTFGSAAGLTAGCQAIAVDFSSQNPVIYATTSDSLPKLLAIVDTGSSAPAITLATSATNTAFRGVALAPGIAPAAPVVSNISPLATTNTAGSSALFSVTASGSQPLGYYWYKEIPGTSTNPVPGATAPILYFPSTAASDTAFYQAVVSNSFSPPATSDVVYLLITNAPPAVVNIQPLAVITNAGNDVSFTVTGSGTPPLSYAWYKVISGTPTLIPNATNATLLLPSVLGGDSAGYQVVVGNPSPLTATSSVVTLTVQNDPRITSQPSSAFGLISQSVQFTVGAVGTSPAYQWYYTDSGGNVIGPVNNGAQTDGSIISGASGSTLSIANLQPGDATNFVVTVTSAYGGPVSSSVASLLSVGNTEEMAFWDFNGPEFTNNAINPTCVNNPTPYIGTGTAGPVGSAYAPGGTYPFTSTSFSPFSGSVDGNDGLGTTSHLPPFSWGTSQYPTNGNPALNKSAGVQFNVSTLGAKNVKLSYESRFSGTASKYERLQYTTNGTDWIDYPASSSWPSTTITYYPFSYDLSGFPGVANNPDFGVRIVTEYQTTATYGIGTTNNFVGAANTYGTGGTLTYDLVTFSGDAITNNNAPPIIGGIMDTNMKDYLPLTNTFTASDDTTPSASLHPSAVSLNPTSFDPSFSFQFLGGTTWQMITYPNSISQSVAAAPILVRVTDANGDSTVSWFTMSVTSLNLPPTNTLTSLAETNTLANRPLTIPFAVGDDRTAVSGLTYSGSSGNTTVVPNENVVIGNQGTANPTVTITPGSNQLGVATINVTVNDNDSQSPKSTTATIPVMVRPNTNVVAIDYFNYDSSGALDAVSSGLWQHLSGNVGQMQVSGGAVRVDTANNTENLQTPLLGAPYAANSATTLYFSCVVNVDPISPPGNNGTYITAFNDGTLITADVEDLLVVGTNGAAPGDYRVGIANTVGATAANAQMFPVDLQPGNNYTIVSSLTLSNAFSTLWVSPSDQTSPSVTDTTTVSTTYPISDFELRESGANAGAVYVSQLKVGTTFDSVFPSLHVQQAGTNVIVNWSDPTLGIQSSTNVNGPYNDISPTTPPYTNNAVTNGTVFFRFGR